MNTVVTDNNDFSAQTDIHHFYNKPRHSQGNAMFVPHVSTRSSINSRRPSMHQQYNNHA